MLGQAVLLHPQPARGTPFSRTQAPYHSKPGNAVTGSAAYFLFGASGVRRACRHGFQIVPPFPRALLKNAVVCPYGLLDPYRMPVTFPP
jgi:hypothetical protein